MHEKGRRHLLAAVIAAVALLAGCGGGDDDVAPKVAVSRVVVAGDSLADVGTFGGIKFGVQNSADPANGFPGFTQIVAQNFGVNGQCNFFLFNGTTFVPNSRAGCTNFAIGGGRVVVPAAEGGASNPQSVPTQLATAAQVVGGRYTATDLVLVVGGGNDSGDLLQAFLGAGTGAAGVANYQAFLAQQLSPQTIAATLPQPNGAAAAAVLYMKTLADTYYDAVKVNALDKGATHVAVLDVPDISLTPRIQAVLTGVVAPANGGGAAGAAAAAAVQALIRQWTDAFNTELRARVAGDTRVAVVPFNADFTEEVTHAADFGLSNVSTPSCRVVGVEFFDSPAEAARCTSAALDANPPAGLAPGWWRTWAFADGFHPTPFGHQLLAASVNRALARAGWL
ncbi:SGNH/GDSL hydrolase family protein [Ramlibacter alkalitolerans]|uniref:Phospholipase n=1 Tax=Ramlibacter alkalitolerans TaxID=2039631 RepID=A0ABS1JSP2_9BURK|nr:SGNH/GDSL hydrolase family protein [Ramlibacter alkalitolerans]MBL0427268.1 phospholipase [Ramlibacter alkalitolerans]